MSNSYNHPGRGSSCCCNPLKCCCGCIFDCLCTCIYQIICTILVVLAIVAIVLFIFFRPTPVKFNVTDATLTQFDLATPNDNLHYNLAMNLSIRNPNKRLSIYYDNIEIRALYEGQRFASITLKPFHQRTKTTTNVDNIVLSGQNLVLLHNKGVSKYNQDRGSGVYHIDVDLYLRIRFKASLFKTSHFKPKIHCDLKVPLSVDGNRTSFSPTTCHLAWH
ncbi:hypothetical protein LIER_21370 [Lithospermum erythrorhizon]|uniref:Late embryogenesis abundant protein LEA-2 subgroup domain-containing protein n=1 Tax=Lithospermum erythrorhizon TaxID=34254 RepID=A0AAV3QTG2_LITER